jgi:hypothetical protein
MLVLGLILILGAAALGVGLVYDGGESATAEIFGATVDTTVTGVFLTGAATMLALLVGLWLLTSSMGRARRKRGERKESRRRQRDSVARLEEERTQLRAENERLSERLGVHPEDSAPDGTADGRGPGAATHGRHETDLRPADTARVPRSTDTGDRV